MVETSLVVRCSSPFYSYEEDSDEVLRVTSSLRSFFCLGYFIEVNRVLYEMSNKFIYHVETVNC